MTNCYNISLQTMGNRNTKCKHDKCANIGKYAFEADRELGYVVCEDHIEKNMIRIVCTEPTCTNIAKYAVRDDSHDPSGKDPTIRVSATYCADHLRVGENQCSQRVRCIVNNCLSILVPKGETSNSEVCIHDYCKEHANQILFSRYQMCSPTEHSKCLVKQGLFWPVACHRKRHAPFNVCEWHINEVFSPSEESDYSDEVWFD